MTLYDAIRYLHIGAGTIALATFWTAATLRKGSDAHRVVGRTFMIMIAVLSATGVVIALNAFRTGQTVKAAFLLYLVLITVTACWLAWRAVRDKRDFKKFTGPVYRSLAWTNIAAGAGMLYLGVQYRQIVIAALSSVGFLAGRAMLRFASKEPTEKQWWLARHYNGILGTGVATHVAFLNLGLSHLFDLGGMGQKLSWALPFVVALLARVWLERKYSRR